MRPTVLVVDDERLVRWSLRQHLEDRGYVVVEAETGAEALEAYKRGVDLVLLDYCLPDRDGISILEEMRSTDPDPPIILLTAHSSVGMAVEAMKKGAYHFAAKPFALEDVGLLVDKALETTRLRREVSRLLQDEEARSQPIVGDSPPMKQAKALLSKIARSPASTVLITGESGTGKDVAARYIHSQSDRAAAPFMNITCSALPSALLESELFGHERGAFTDAKQRKKGLLELSDGGTVFLDEVAEMTPALQAKLLRFLEEKAFRRVGGNTDIRPDVRVIAATHQDLQDAIREGGFRADLYYRLAVLHVHLPPLRERPGDIELLAKYFMDRFNREFNKRVRGLTPAALRALESQTWPGNLRELRNTIERAVILSEGETIDASDLFVPAAASPRREDGQFVLPPEGVDLASLERDLVIQALERARGNQTRAAKLLGITRDQVRYRIAKFDLNVPAPTEAV